MLTRATRLQPAEAIPDLTGAIMAAVADGGNTRVAGGLRDRVRSLPSLRELIDADTSKAPWLLRLTLLLVAFAQVIIAVPALFGDDLGATIHVAHEQGAWGLALAAGLAFGAWRPSRASAMVPVLSVFVVCLGCMTAMDIAAHRVAPSAEVPHLMAAFGLVLLWLQTHPPAALVMGRPAPSAQRVRRLAA